MVADLANSGVDITSAFERHNVMVYRICFAYMKNAAETEDAVQDVFVKLLKSRAQFENAEHEKAWLIRTAANTCKNMLRHWWRKRENIDEYEHLTDGGIKTDDVISAVTDLPNKYKTVVYLYYYEGYDSAEIAAMLKKPASTIRNYLHEARKVLKEKLLWEGGMCDEKQTNN